MPVTDMHTVRVTGYIDEKLLLCYRIVKLQSLVFHPYKFLKFNVQSFYIQLKDSYFQTRIDDIRIDSYTEPALMTALLDVIDR